ncbi:MAG: winged helix-turn-helix domain-containing protein [Betaproteobacteria bacterium]
MCIQWVSFLTSDLFSQVMNDMAVACSVHKLQAHLQFNLPEIASECDVLVIELAHNQIHLQSDWIKNFSGYPSSPLMLVLLPTSEEQQAISLLNAGADRCMPRESDIGLIQAMVRSMLQRRRGHVATYTEHAMLRFEHSTNTLFYQSQRLPLTHRETLVAGLMFRHVGRHVRHDQILKLLAGDEQKEINPALVSLYVHRINRKIRPYGVHIGFKRGYGYRLYVDSLQVRESTSVEWLGDFPVTSACASKVNHVLRIDHHVNQ